MRTSLSLVVLLAVLMPAASPAIAIGYAVRDLGTLPGGVWSCAFALNDKGNVVGVSGDVQGKAHIVLWDANGAMTDLGIYAGSRSPGTFDMNDSGQVVVYERGLWTSESGWTGVYSLGMSSVTGINDGGQIVGSISNGHAALRNPDGKVVDLGTLPGRATSWALDINNRGEVVGWSGNRAFMWTSGNGMTELPRSPGSTESYAYAVNNSGQVAGSLLSLAFTWDGVVWDVDGSIIHAEVHRPYDINDAGQVVGSNGALWSANTGLVALPPLPGGQINDANSINSLGQVVGMSMTSDGDYHAVLWQSVPEPSAALALTLACAFGSLTWLRNRTLRP